MKRPSSVQRDLAKAPIRGRGRVQDVTSARAARLQNSTYVKCHTVTIVVVDALGLSYLKLIALFLLQFSTNSRL